MRFEMDIIRGESEGRERGDMAKDRVKAVSKLVMKEKFGVIDTVEKVITVWVEGCAAEAMRCIWGWEEGDTKFAS